jgi:hypothetical protein
MIVPSATALPALLTTLSLVFVAFTMRQSDAPYTVRSTDSDAATLLAADDDAWENAVAVAWGTDPWPTTFRALAAADALWLRFDAVDDAPWHTYTVRDDKLWEEEVVEIFIDPDGDHRNYVEVEVNPANVVCDLMVERGAPNLLAHIDWDFPGLESAVVALLDDSGTTIGWSAVVRLPWEGFRSVPDTTVPLPPQAGDRWRFNVFRIKRPFGPREPQRRVVLDAWSPVPGRSFHVPEVFRVMEFE